MGTALILKRNLAFTDVVKQPQGLMIRVDVGDRTVINIYAKREERAHFFREILPVDITSATESKKRMVTSATTPVVST